MSKIYVNDCIMIKADITQSKVRIWPPTHSFQFSRRHLLAEKASLTAAPWKGGRAQGKVGVLVGSGGPQVCQALGVEQTSDPSLFRVYKATLCRGVWVRKLRF